MLSELPFQVECRKIIEIGRTTVTLWSLANLSQSRESRAQLNRHIILSVDHIWRKQGPANQSGSHLSASRSGPKDSEIFFEELQVS